MKHLKHTCILELLRIGLVVKGTEPTPSDPSWVAIDFINAETTSFKIEGCQDDLSTRDSRNDDCTWYNLGINSNKCGNYDDSDFTASVSCCVCGGGSTASHDAWTYAHTNLVTDKNAPQGGATSWVESAHPGPFPCFGSGDGLSCTD